MFDEASCPPPRLLPLGCGDQVEVALQGRRHAGLVVATAAQPPPDLPAERIQPIASVLQPAAVDPAWRALIDAVADACHTSRFRTLKSALPPGWLGQRPIEPAPKGCWAWELVMARWHPASGAHRHRPR